MIWNLYMHSLITDSLNICANGFHGDGPSRFYLDKDNTNHNGHIIFYKANKNIQQFRESTEHGRESQKSDTHATIVGPKSETSIGTCTIMVTAVGFSPPQVKTTNLGLPVRSWLSVGGGSDCH